MVKLSDNPFDILSRQHRQADVRYRTEDGWPRCEALTYKKTQCTRMGNVRKVEVFTDTTGEPVDWKKEIQWRCGQHGG